MGEAWSLQLWHLLNHSRSFRDTWANMEANPADGYTEPQMDSWRHHWSDPHEVNELEDRRSHSRHLQRLRHVNSVAFYRSCYCRQSACCMVLKILGQRALWSSITAISTLIFWFYLPSPHFTKGTVHWEIKSYTRPKLQWSFFLWTFEADVYSNH